MIKESLPIQILILLLFGCSKFDNNPEHDEKLNPDCIESIKISTQEIPEGFLLFQERLSKPNKSTDEQVYQFWRRESFNQCLVLIEETKQKIADSASSSSFQIWYRDLEIEKKDKIEIDIIICLSTYEMEKTITYFTEEAFSSPFSLTENPMIGEKTWIPKALTQNSYSIMFLRFNVFVRVFVGLNNQNIDEIRNITESIAKKIENNIVL